MPSVEKDTGFMSLHFLSPEQYIPLITNHPPPHLPKRKGLYQLSWHY